LKCSEGKTVAVTSTSPINLFGKDSNQAENESVSGKENTINEDAVRQWNSTTVKSKWKEKLSEFPAEVLNIIDCIPEASIYANCVCDLELHYDEDEIVSNNSLVKWF